MECRYVQTNLNHCRDAQDLFWEFARSEDIGVALVSEPYGVGAAGWHLDSTGLAALGVLGRGLTLGEVENGDGFVSATVGGVSRVYSCYASPAISLDEFEQFLSRLEASVRKYRGDGVDLVIGGDFNARSASWGDHLTNARGDALADFASSLGMVVMNAGSEPTFFGRGEGSCVDVTFASESAARKIRGWTVRTDVENMSDHHHICFDYGPVRTFPRATGVPTTASPAGRRRPGWRSDRMDADLLAAAWIAVEWAGTTLPPVLSAAPDDAEAGAERLVESVTAACDMGLPPRSTHPGGRTPVYWWNGRIAAARTECVRRRRLWTRSRGRCHEGAAAAAAEAEYREARKVLKRCIREAKAKCWAELVKSVDDDPWGKPYKVVLKKLRGPPATATMEPRTVRDIAAVLFPEGDGDGVPADLFEQPVVVPEFTLAEVDAAVGRFRSRGKAPGPDGIPSRVWGVVHAARPDRLTDVFNRCLREGTFPGRWKHARLALIAKPGKPVGVPSSYRPLCLLDDVGKIFESLLVVRIDAHMAATGVGLSERQFGFRSGRSTDDALRLLQERLVAAVDKGRFAVAVSLDIRNAFNTIGWRTVREALIRMDFPPYLRRILGSYLSARSLHLCDDSTGDPVTTGVTRGVPQGSVLGPLLWNVAYDTVFRLPMPRGTIVSGYADDTLVVVEGDTVESVQNRANAALASVAGHIRQLGLRLAVDKTEAVVFKNQYRPVDLRLRIEGQIVRPGASLKYLGVVLENKGTWFGAHFRAAADKARRVMTALSRLMPNVGGPREGRRRLLSSVVHSVLLYGAPTWAPTLPYDPRGVEVLASVQRRAAVASVCAYRTVSYDAVTVVSRTVPIDLMAHERYSAFEARRASRRTVTIGDQVDEDATASAAPPQSLRDLTVAEWVRRYRRTEPIADSGREWTRTLIPPGLLSQWVNRPHGEMTFRLTQLMTGHGCFNRFLHRIGRAPSVGCSHCGPTDELGDEEDDAHHTLQRCEAFECDRERLVLAIGPFDPGDLVRLMLESPENWRAVARFAEDVMTAKEQAEFARQSRFST